MRHLIILLALLSLLLAAEPVAFQETRHMAALGIERQMSGTIVFEGDEITIHYQKPREETVHYQGESIQITGDGKSEQIPLSKAPQLALFFDLIAILHTSDADAITSHFDHQSHDDGIRLTPPDTHPRLKRIDINPSLERIERFTIVLHNGDWIRIEKL
jgi:hypothetical protein